MRRFRANLQKVHDLCEQQRRLAELDLARAAQALAEAERTEQAAEQAVAQARDAVVRVMKTRTGIGSIRSTRNDVQRTEEQLVAARQHVARSRTAWEQECERSRVLKSKTDRLAELISRQRDEHRKDAFREQQVAMDELSAARRSQQHAHSSEVMHHA